MSYFYEYFHTFRRFLNAHTQALLLLICYVLTERSNKSQALHTKRIDNETDALDNLNPFQNLQTTGINRNRGKSRIRRWAGIGTRIGIGTGIEIEWKGDTREDLGELILWDRGGEHATTTPDPPATATAPQQLTLAAVPFVPIKIKTLLCY